MDLHRLEQDISTKRGVYILHACFFVAGIIDAAAFATWGVFANLQTGNTITLAARISGEPQTSHKNHYTKSLAAIAAYCIGSFIFGAIVQFETKKQHRRWRVMTIMLLQTVLLIVCAALAQSHVVSNRATSDHNIFSSGSEKIVEGVDNYLDLLPIALLAFQAAGQVTLSRILAFNDLPTIVISTLYHDFFAGLLHARADINRSIQAARSEKCFWNRVKSFGLNTMHNDNQRQDKQLQRLGAIASLIQGVGLAAMVYKKWGLAPCLWISAAVKGGLCFVVLFWRAEAAHDPTQEVPDS